MYSPSKDLTNSCETLYQQSLKNLDSDCYHLEDEVIVLLYQTVEKLAADKQGLLESNAALFHELDQTQTKLLSLLMKQLHEKGLTAGEALMKDEVETKAGVDGKKISITEMLIDIFKNGAKR